MTDGSVAAVRAVSPARLSAMTIAPGSTLRGALQAIQAGAARVCVVIAGDVLVGIVTDGDARRALLGGADLADPIDDHIVGDPYWVGPRESRAGVLALMRARGIDVVPVLDDRRLVELLVLDPGSRPGRPDDLAVIMAGGRGRRMGSLTDELPKPMLPVAGRPILEHIVERLVDDGFGRIAISVNYLAEAITSHFGDGSRYGCEIRYLRESPHSPLGSAGSLSLLRDAGIVVRGAVLVLNGDVLCDASLGDLVDRHLDSGADITVCTSTYHHTVPFGVVATDAEQVDRIDEKPTHTWQINAGVYAMAPTVPELVAADTFVRMTDLIAGVLADGGQVAAHRLPGAWLDIGEPAQLERAADVALRAAPAQRS